MASEWTNADPVLATGEEGHETDTGQRKVGDGVSLWSELPYFGDSGSSEPDPDVYPAGDTTQATDGQVWTFDSASGAWLPKDASGGVSSYGDLTDVPETFPPSAHGHANATTSAAGFESAADKAKLNRTSTGFVSRCSVDGVMLEPSTFTKIPFGTPDFASLEGFDAVDGSWVCQDEGAYSLGGVLTTRAGVVPDANILVYLYKNDSLLRVLAGLVAASTRNISMGRLAIADAVPDDYFELFAVCYTPGGAIEVQEYSTYFEGWG
jgi:hypothetical protein